MLLQEGLEMTEVLLLERCWITRSDSNKALKYQQGMEVGALVACLGSRDVHVTEVPDDVS